MNKADKIRYQKLSDMGCIICLRVEFEHTPPEIHHLITLPRKDNQRTIPLCYWHHREGSNKSEYISRHPNFSEWENRYGTEEHWLKETNKLI